MTARWLEHYDPGVPWTIDHYLDKTLVDFVAEHAKSRPDAPAARFKGRDVSFRQLHEESDALARSLAALGVKRGDRVALLLPNCPQFLVAELAAWKLGAIIAPQNPIYTERELEASLATTDPETIVVLTPFYERVKRIQANTKLKNVIATNIKEYLPGVLRVLFTIAKEKKEGHRIDLRSGDHWFQDLLKPNGNGGLKPTAPDDPAVVLMSGGTTGTPKAAMSTHRSLIMAGTQLRAWLHAVVDAPGGSIMLPLPLFHTYGCSGAQVITLMAGIPLILVPNPRDLGDVVKTIQRYRPALLCGVPTLFNALLNHPDVVRGKVDFRSIKACFSGAAALMAETRKRFEELTGGTIVEGYSLTEATMACCANPLAGTRKIGSVGVPVTDVTVKILDADTGTREMPEGEVGEIVLEAPQLMEGYWNNPAETAEMIRGGRLYSGDLAYMDEDGYVFIVDRKKDLIKTSGYQVWPREVEEVIAAHPAVAEVGVAGLPDSRKSEIIAAWVVRRPDETLDEETLRAWCREKLAPYKVPARIEFRTELPKTMVGKVLRRVLVSEAKSQQP